jgi:hypothetical protein
MSTSYKNKLLEQEITRKEFLTYVTMAMASIFGLKNFLDLLTGHHQGWSNKSHSQDATKGFGGGKFGV